MRQLIPLYAKGRFISVVHPLKCHFNIFSSLPVSLLCCLMLIQPEVSFSQVTDTTGDYGRKEDYIEQLVEKDDNSGGDYEGLVDLDRNLRQRPINLNTATEEDLKQLHELALLTDIQIHSIINYRDKLGNFISIYELQAVPYLDMVTVKSLLPYVRINSDISHAMVNTKDLLLGGDYVLLIRAQQVLEEQKGFTPVDSGSTASRYLGSPLNLYARYRYQYGTKFSYGITGQKDAGEEFFQGTQKQGFDFYSFHIYYRGNSFIKAVAAGDYELRFGQGLLTASGFGVSKSSLVMNVKYGGRTLKPYTSTNEFNFFRGGAVVVGNKLISLTAFASSKRIDGNIGTIDTVDEDVFVTSIGGDGLHRTPSEVADKNTVHQTVTGFNADFNIQSLQLGASAIYSKYSVPLAPAVEPYNEFKFRGSQLTTGGIHYDWAYRNFLLFGEAAMDEDGGKALLSGMLISVDQNIDLSLIYRNYGKDFHSLYANAFGESGTNDNESGLYTGILLRPGRSWQIAGYVDLFRKPWLDYNIDAPSNGIEMLTQVTYKPNKVLEIYARWKDESKQQNASINAEPLDYIVGTRKQNLRLNLSYKASSSFTIHSRAEWVFYHEEQRPKQYGFLAYQDLIYHQLGSPLQLTARVCLFDADDYDARIYAYENDVLYAYSVPSFSNRGMRFYVVARYSISRGIDVWLRFAQTYYSNLDVIGSGLDEINGNTKTELKAEVRFKF
ncbi:MAG: helix-hairpin-helix domain-containing protein [Chitinophagales bacterium]|nr:helix-hairpin-helix domain-containing protein [Chitinophagales bacterium]